MCREGPEGGKRHKESKVGTLKHESPTRYSEPPLDQVPYFLFAPCEDSEHPMYSLHPSPSSRPLPFLLAPRLVASPVLRTFPFRPYYAHQPLLPSPPRVGRLHL